MRFIIALPFLLAACGDNLHPRPRCPPPAPPTIDAGAPVEAVCDCSPGDLERWTSTCVPTGECRLYRCAETPRMVCR